MFAVAHTAEWTPTRNFLKVILAWCCVFFLYFIRATFYAFIYLFKHKETNRICVGIQFTDTHTRE